MKLKSNLTIFFLPVLFLLFFSCNKEKIIKEDKLIQIYSDMLIAQDTVALSSAGVDSLREAVFKKYDVTEELYKTTPKILKDGKTFSVKLLLTLKI